MTPTAHRTAALFALTATAALATAQDKPAAPPPAAAPPAAARAFEPFRAKVKVRWDAKWLYVESDGMPAHEMMTGIRAWQQQVPLPQPYTGDNAWRVPLQPEPAQAPKSARTGFFRGAIAIAINGVPIFNPIKNDGHTDTFLAGELDVFGGHAGRADDYHYHVAPVFLNGGDPSKPVAYALDGYPIYGFLEPDGAPARTLDELNGHEDAKYGYHYHATKDYPYLNGGFHGEVTEAEGQVDPQPHAHSVRPATSPLPGARITKFEHSEDGRTYTLTYDLRGRTGKVEYTTNADGSVRFVFTEPNGQQREQTYQPDRRAPGRNAPRFQAADEPPAGAAPRGDRPTEPGREPWLKAHLREIDGDKDGQLTRVEVMLEAMRTFVDYDRDDDGAISVAERDTPGAGRSAMGGFVKQHWTEVDRDGDDRVTAIEIRRVGLSMFDKQDRNGDGVLDADELAQDGGGRRRGDRSGGNGGGEAGNDAPRGGRRGPGK